MLIPCYLHDFILDWNFFGECAKVLGRGGKKVGSIIIVKVDVLNIMKNEQMGKGYILLPVPPPPISNITFFLKIHNNLLNYYLAILSFDWNTFNVSPCHWVSCVKGKTLPCVYYCLHDSVQFSMHLSITFLYTFLLTYKRLPEWSFLLASRKKNVELWLIRSIHRSILYEWFCFFRAFPALVIRFLQIHR